MADVFSSRQNIIRVLFIAAASILVLRLFKLQIFDDYGDKAGGQSIYRKVIFPSRGNLKDRKGKDILNNVIKYNLCLTPKYIDKNLDTASLCKILGITDSAFRAAYKKALNRELNRNKPIPVFKELSEESVARLQELIYNYPGLELQAHTVRYSSYACGGLAIGYTGEISAKMLEEEKYSIYNRGDYLGLSGLEKSYEEILRGTIGVQYITRDNLNRPTGSYKKGKLDTSAVKGKDLELYMDIELEQYAEKLLANKLGSLVAIDPKTGGILAMVSTPSFDPNIMNDVDRSVKMSKMLIDATKPLMNRATQAVYAPGSTFKPLTALVALDQGLINGSYGYPCGGRYSACGGKIDCTHAGGGHARDLGYAMANSCNSYFCHLFRLAVDNPRIGDKRKGLEKWKQYMNQFGLGHPLGIDYPQEKGGYIPDNKTYDKMYPNNSWNSCNNCMNGMGQGEILTTPLQMANSLCLIANRGFYYTPHFVKSIGGDTAHPAIKKYLNKITPVHIPQEAYTPVILGMEAVISNGGTGTIARIPGVRLAGKTGTAENYAYLSLDGVPVKQPNNSMFVAYGPIDDPKICVAVVVENSGYGATWAGPIASLVIQKYLQDSIPKSRKGLEKKMMTSKVIPKNVYLIDSVRMLRDSIRMSINKRRKDSIDRVNGKKITTSLPYLPNRKPKKIVYDFNKFLFRRNEHNG